MQPCTDALETGLRTNLGFATGAETVQTVHHRANRAWLRVAA
jgi:hypothetical protein